MPTRIPLSNAELFEERALPEPMSGCWLWLGPRNVKGYGVFREGPWGRLATHYVYAREYGALAPNTLLMHTCDTPACVNIHHLRVGTIAENQADMKRKGRANRGEKCTSAKLTRDEVALIRASAELHAELAERYGVHQSTITRIKNHKRWAWLNAQQGDHQC